MKFLIFALSLLPGVSMAADYTCQVNGSAVTLEEFTNPKADITAYHYQGKAQGYFISVMYVDGAYDLYIEHGADNFTESRAESLDFKVNLEGDTLEIQCQKP
jgi:hypothetical protein